MTRYIAFLRAINVGGHAVRMEALRSSFEDLGFEKVQTFIASGNVIFGSRSKSVPRLAERIEKHLADILGYEVATFIRTDAEVAAIARSSPFAPAAMQSAGAVCVGLLARPLTGDGVRRLEALATGIDDFRALGQEIWWMCQRRQSESKFSNAAFEKAVGVRATFRGFNTMRRLAALYPAP